MSDNFIKKNIIAIKIITIIIISFENLSMIFSMRQYRLLTSTKSIRNSNTIRLFILEVVLRFNKSNLDVFGNK